MITLWSHIVILIFYLILLWLGSEGLFVVIFSLITAGMEVFLWARRERKHSTLNWCHPVTFFVLGYCIVFYQLPFCYLADFELSYYSQYVIFHPQDIPYCVLLAASGLSAFFIGEHIFFLRSKNISKPVRDVVTINYRSESYFTYINTIQSITLVLTIFFFILFLRSLGGFFDNYFGFEYGDSSIRSTYSVYFEFAYIIFFYLSILLGMSRLVYKRPKSTLEYLDVLDRRVLIVTVFTLIPFVLSGDRDTFLQPLALLVTPYFIIVKPLRFSRAFVLIVIAAFALALVGDTRSYSAFSWFESLKSRIENVANPAQWPTMELANSFGTFNISTTYFPHSYPYNYGLNTFYRFASLIPFSSVITEIEKKNEQTDFVFSSTLFFTNILTRGSFSSGTGTSSLADIYMDFGPYGIPIVLFLWGVFMAWICDRALTDKSETFMFLYSYYVFLGIYVNRSSFFFGWNKFVWIFLIFYFVKLLYFRKSGLNA